MAESPIVLPPAQQGEATHLPWRCDLWCSAVPCWIAHELLHTVRPLAAFNFIWSAGNDRPNRALDRMAPDYRTVPDYQHLQLVCERQAVVASKEEVRRAFKNLAEEYRKMAEFLEQKLQEQQKH